MRKSLILFIFLIVDACVFSQNIDTLKNIHLSKPNIEYLSLPLGVTFLSHQTGIEYFSGLEYHLSHISVDGAIGFYPQNTWRHFTKFIYGLGISLYQKDAYGFYISTNYTINGVYYHFLDNTSLYNNYDNPFAIMGGYRVAGKYLSLKVGAGYYWAKYISGMVYEAKLGIRLFNTNLISRIKP
jgi:hypothetical protein